MRITGVCLSLALLFSSVVPANAAAHHVASTETAVSHSGQKAQVSVKGKAKKRKHKVKPKAKKTAKATPSSTKKPSATPKPSTSAKPSSSPSVSSSTSPSSKPSSSPSKSPSASPSPSVSKSSSTSPSPVPPKLYVTSKPLVVVASQNFVIGGLISPSPTSAAVRIDQQNGAEWSPIASTSTAKNGRWSISLSAPATFGHIVLRVVAIGQYSPSLDIRIAALPAITVAGPGARILGADISQYQHSSLPIDFKRMAKSGVAYVYLKASDGYASADAIARTTASADTVGARSAGIYVGFYHVAKIPSSNLVSTLRLSAQTQAKLALARLAELGGYDGYTLPYALDIELAPKGVKASGITLWAKTWLEAMYKATNRRPVIYSYRSYLASKFLNDSTTWTYLRQAPLWLAQPGDPSSQSVIPGHYDAGAGCYKTAWTLADCTANWSFWQYTSSGDRETYGIPWSPKKGASCPSGTKYCSAYVGQPRRHLDLNVFNGSIADLMSLALGTWKQSPVPQPNPTPSPQPNPTPSH